MFTSFAFIHHFSPNHQKIILPVTLSRLKMPTKEKTFCQKTLLHSLFRSEQNPISLSEYHCNQQDHFFTKKYFFTTFFTFCQTNSFTQGPNLSFHRCGCTFNIFLSGNNPLSAASVIPHVFRNLKSLTSVPFLLIRVICEICGSLTADLRCPPSVFLLRIGIITQ